MKNYKKIAISLMLLLSINFVFGQGQTWRWNFGANAALNFPGGGPPVATPGSAMNTFEGCASIGTPAGALAFYTDGNKVWGANNVQMPNGFGLFGNSSTTQAAIIVPKPGSATMYYIFACSSNFSPGTLSYSEVDMTLNAGFGNVTAVKNVVVQNNIAEKLTAVRHCNGVDVWVICHDYTNSNYYAFLVTAAGVSVTPVVSAAGAPCSGNVVGVIKSSPNGKRIAYCASNGPFALHVADFNNTTGVVSNAINLAGNAALVPMYGLEFSPDSKILYGSKWAGTQQVYQWDICNTNTAAVVASALMVGSGGNTHGQMQLGPDGKIYVARAGSSFLGVINNPNTLGVGCGYNQNGVSVAPGTSQYGLPTFIQSYLKTPPPPFTFTMSCLTGQFAAPNMSAMVQGCTTSTVNPVISYLWNFGDPPSVPNNTSNIANPTHVFSAPGTYTVKLVMGYGCGGDTITGVVTAVSCGPTVKITGKSFCPGECGVLTATATGGTGPYTYAWTPNIGTGPGPFTVCPTSTTIYSVSILDAFNAPAMDTAIMVVNPIPTITVTNPTVCLNSSFTLSANGGTAYTWSGPNTFTSNLQNPTISTASLSSAGNYTVIGSGPFGCTNTAVANVGVVNLPNITITPVSPSLCANNYNSSSNTVVINANGATTYTWTGFSGLTANSTSLSSITTTAMPAFAIGTGTVMGTFGTCTNVASFSVAIIPNPIMSVTSASMCFGTSADLVASGAGSYVWSPPSFLNSTSAATVTANPNVTTVYSVYGSSLNCNSPSVTSTVTVVPNPTITISPATATICSGGNIVLNASGASSYTWSPSSTLNNSNGNSVIASPNVTTNYTVIGAQNGCTASAVRQVQVITIPGLFAVASRTSICSGEATSINANGALSYTWSPSTNVDHPNSNFVTVNPPVTTVYSLIGNNGMCTSSVAVTINVVPKPILNITTSNQKICFGNSTTLFASGAQNYIWTPNLNMHMSSNNVAIVTPATSTNYTITGSNTSGTVTCSMTQELLIDVIPQVTASISNSVVLCEGQSTQLNSGGSNKYVWAPETGLSNPYIASPYATPSITTVYTVYVSTDGFCGAAKTVLVKVSPKPEVYAGPDQMFNLDEPMYLNASGSGTLTWIAGEGIICHACPNSQITPSNSGVYVVEAVNKYGCKAQDEMHVEVTKDYNIYIPNVFTPNFDGNNDIFFVHGTGITKIEMIIYDRWGEKLYTSTEQLKGWDGTYKGVLCKNDAYVYLVNFTTLDGKKHTKSGHVSLLK